MFISYKASQVDGARALRKTLKDYAADKLEIFLAEESIRGGEDWQARIYGLTKAHWLIVLYPELSHDSTWVVFETGHFHGRDLPGDRLLCIHPAHEFPFEGVSPIPVVPSEPGGTPQVPQPDAQGSRPGGRTMPAINASLSEDALRDAAAKLAQVLEPQTAVWTTCGACLDVKVKGSAGRHDEAALLAGWVEDATNIADVFGVRDRAAVGRTLGELLEKLPDVPHKDLWVANLALAAKNALDGDAVMAKVPASWAKREPSTGLSSLL